MIDKLNKPKYKDIPDKINEIIDNLQVSGANIDLSNLSSTGESHFLKGDVDANISALFTFLGQKRVSFKQSSSSDKLGFTCFNASGTEIGAFEYRPSTIGSGALFNINVPYTSTSYVGFRYWGTAVNVVAPKVATAGTYYIPTHITDGNTSVTANNQGTVDISSLNVANTNLTNVPYVSKNLQFSQGLKLYSDWGFIGLDTSNSTSNEVLNITDILPSDDSVNPNSSVTLQVNGNTILDGTTNLIPDARLSSNIARTSQIPSISNLADKDLSNLSTTGQAVIDGKVNKSGDTMTGGLTTELSGTSYINKNTDYTLDTPPASSVYADILQGQDGTGHTMMGIGNHYMSNGEHYARMYATKDTNNNAWATIDVGFNENAQRFTRAFACDLVNSILITSGIKKQILDNGSSYMNLGNGIKVCWGYHSASTNSTITFPVTYTATNSYICIAFSRSANTSGHVQAVSATQSTIYWASSTSYIWIAIGY